MTETAMKKTRGRRRIPIQRIENKAKRSVAFSKRKAGLFKKASELSTLCGSGIAVLVFSGAGKAFTFGHPSADSVVQRYVTSSDSLISTTQSRNSTNPISADQFGCGAFGWDNRIDSLGLDELKLYSNYLQNIRDVVAAKATSMDCSSAYNTTTDVSNHGLSVQENSFGGLEMHSKYLDVERAMIDSPTTVDGDSQECMLYGEGTMDDGFVSTTTSGNDFYVQEKCVDDAQLGDLDVSKYLEEMIDFGVDGAMVDSPTDVNGDSQLSDCDYFKWKEANEGNVDALWGNSLCDIQWEEDLDLLGSFLQD